MKRTIDEELFQLRGVFPSLNSSDFKELPNGNICIELSYQTRGQFAKGKFDVLIEFLPSYPSNEPIAWIQNLKISSDAPHTYEADEWGDMKICYIHPSDWSYSNTSYDVAIMIQTWIWAYCKWLTTGDWDWETAD